MKKTDIQTDNVVYVCGEGSADYSDRYAAVIIDTRTWEFTWERARGYGEPIGVRLANTSYRTEGTGMLAIREGRNRRDTSISTFNPAALLKVVAEHRGSLLLGATPELGPDYSIVMIRPQGVRDTWAQHVEEDAAARAARVAKKSAEEAARAADIAAANRINGVLKRPANDFGHVYLPSGALALEELLEEYAAQRIQAREEQARSFPDA